MTSSTFRSRLPNLIGPLAFVVCLCLSPAARADVITFLDTTDTLTVAHSGADRLVEGLCTGETCLVNVISISGALPPFEFPEVNILEPTTGLVSDTFFIGHVSGPSIQMGFTSDSDAGPLSPFPLPTATIVEDGTVQTLLTVTWDDGTTDTIRFQSDVEVSVPEPSALLLLGSGLAGLAGLAWRRGGGNG